MRCETGATWLDLVATVAQAYGPAPVDRLDGAAALGEWLAAEDLLPSASPSVPDLARTRALREALRGLGLAAVRGEPWPEDGVRLVNEVLADDRPLGLGEGRLRRPATTREALGRIARQAAEQLTGPAAQALGRCADPVCGLLFLDPGGRRRWCAAEVCGVRHRVRVHRERKAKGP